MKHAKEETFCNGGGVIDLISAVKELHGFTSQELNKLIRETENFSFNCHTEKGSSVKIEVEKLANFLPLHLIALLISSERDKELFRYLLSGRPQSKRHAPYAFHTCGMQSIFINRMYIFTVAGSCSSITCTPQAVHVIIMFLQIKLSEQHTDLCIQPSLTDEQVVNYICQQCEASLQFLQSLCQQKMFRERLLRNKELCGQGGVLFLAQSILKLSIMPPFVESSTIVASVSRLKAKVLSILLNLYEVESISYLDEVASSPGILNLAKSVALEVLELLKNVLTKDPKHLSSSSGRTYSMGLLQLNAMRLADIFSNDSNFRSYITLCFTEVLSAIFSLSHGDFLLIWCSSEFPIREEDATVEYDSFAAAGWVLDTVSSLNMSTATKVEFSLTQNSMPQASCTHTRTSLFVKIIATRRAGKKSFS